MRLMNKIVLVIMLVTAGLTLSGCDDTVKPTVKIIDEHAFRETATVIYQLTDKDEVIANSSFMAKIYEKDDDTVVDSVSLDEEDFDEVEIDFDGLEVNTDYKVKFWATYNKKLRTIGETTLKTSEVGGSVEKANKITTYEELVTAGKDPSGHHILMNDIDCEGQEIDPLFLSTSKKLTGGFDGNEKTISNFKITDNTAYVGLFGVVGKGAYVKRLNVKDVVIDVARASTIYVGGLIGKNEGAISDITIDGLSIVVEGTSTNNMFAGGLIGYNTETAVVTNCTITGGKATNVATATADVVADDQTDDTTTDKKEELDLTESDKDPVDGVIKIIAPGTSYVGGFVGNNQADATAPEITNCTTDMDIEYILYNDYASSSKDFKFKVNLGGFAGYNAGAIKASTTSNKISFISYIAKEDKVESLSLRIGGFAGKNIVEINNCTVTSFIDVKCEYADDIAVGGYVGVIDTFFDSTFDNKTVFEDIKVEGLDDAKIFIGNDFGKDLNEEQQIS